MKKILFILFAALAFVACEKENPEENFRMVNGNQPMVFDINPEAYNVESEAVIKIKTPIPTFNSTYAIDWFSFSTGVKEIPKEFPLSNENEYYKLIQTSADTYEITIKSFDKPYKLNVNFINTDDKILNIGHITINYTPAE